MDLAEDGNSFKQEFLLRFCWKNVSSRMLGLFDLVIPEEEAANNIHILKTAPRTVWLPTNETRTVKFIRIKDFFFDWEAKFWKLRNWIVQVTNHQLSFWQLTQIHIYIGITSEIKKIEFIDFLPKLLSIFFEISLFLFFDYAQHNVKAA